MSLFSAVLLLTMASMPVRELERAQGEISYVVGQDASPYQINIGRRNDIIPLVFEFPCHTRPAVERSVFEIQFLGESSSRNLRAESEFIAFARLVNKAEKEFDAVVPIICDGPIVVPIRLVITDPKYRTAEARFRLSKSSESQMATAKEAGRLEAARRCIEQRHQDAVEWQAKLQRQLLRAGRGEYFSHNVENTAKSEEGNLVVYIDRVKRFGVYGIIEFRVENLNVQPIHIGAVKITAPGSDFEQAVNLAVERSHVEAEKKLPSRVVSAQALISGEATMEVALGVEAGQQTSLDPAARIWGAVMFPYPWPILSPGAVNLTLSTTGNDHVVVTDIPFRGE
jgi:hypothetical protein